MNITIHVPWMLCYDLTVKLLCVFTEELSENKEKSEKLEDENSALKTDLTQSQVNLDNKSDMVIDLQGIVHF